MTTRRDFLTTALALYPAAAAVGASPINKAPAYSKMMDAQSNLDILRAAHRATGAAFAYWDGATFHSAVSGKRNSVTGDPMTPDTLMQIGSITKIFNATLVMQLVDDGRVSLTDPVLRHLPELKTRDMDALRKITVGMLINHSSGINGDWLPEYGPDQERIVDAIDRCAGLDQLHAPGEATSYNNVATVIAGYLVQKLRGQSWYTVMRNRLYEPLGMDHALVDPLQLPRYRVSVGDLADPESGRMIQTKRPFLAPCFAPAGSTQMMTATALVDFARTLLAGGVDRRGARILSEASARRMLQPTATFERIGQTQPQVGLGWLILPGGVVYHNGGGPGVSAYLRAHPPTGRVAALIVNTDTGGALREALLDPIVRSWTGLPAQAAPAMSDKPIDPSLYAGAYEDTTFRLEIQADRQTLSMVVRPKMDLYDNVSNNGSVPPPPQVALRRVEGEDLFLADDAVEGDRLIRFVRPDKQGRMGYIAKGLRLMARVSS